MTNGMMGQLTGTYFDGASCPIQAGEGVFALRPVPIIVWGQGWRVSWWGGRFWTIDGFLRSYEPLQAEFGRDIEWDRFLWSQEFMDYALFKAFAPSDPDIDGLRKWIIPTQPRKRSRLWSESHDPLPAVFQYTSQETL